MEKGEIDQYDLRVNKTPATIRIDFDHNLLLGEDWGGRRGIEREGEGTT